ncbi:MAG TPA: Trm112 family protein [Terracidiphilus sp.]|nr:Trm112 family protein [Terracidiphilus sp.]
MAPDSAPKIRFDASVLNHLACPACFGALRADASRVVCTVCGRAYPIIDGIPVLIAERAEIAGIANTPES